MNSKAIPRLSSANELGLGIGSAFASACILEGHLSPTDKTDHGQPSSHTGWCLCW